MIDLVQRNLNASFSLLRRIAEAKSFGDSLKCKRLTSAIADPASIGQSEELATLSIKTAMQFVCGAYPRGIKRWNDDHCFGRSRINEG